MLKKGGGGWSVVRVPDSALVPEGAGVRAAGGLYVGVCVHEACGFVCGVGQLLGRYGAEGSGLHVGCVLFMLFMLFMQLARLTLRYP